MAFRKDKKQALDWKTWLQRNRPTLVQCGLPEDVYQDRQAWFYFLDHATLSTGNQMHWFSLEQLTVQQWQRLYDFLQAEYHDASYPPHLLRVVQGELRAAVRGSDNSRRQRYHDDQPNSQQERGPRPT